MITKILVFLVGKVMGLRKIHLINLKMIFTRIKVECIMKHIHLERQEKEKGKTLLDKLMLVLLTQLKD